MIKASFVFSGSQSGSIHVSTHPVGCENQSGSVSVQVKNGEEIIQRRFESPDEFGKFMFDVLCSAKNRSER